MSEKLDNHIFMTIAEVCVDLQPITQFTTIDYNLAYFQRLIPNGSYLECKTFKEFLGVIMTVLNRIYGFDDVKVVEYFLKYLSSDKCLKFAKAAYLMKKYSLQRIGNDRYLTTNEYNKITVNI